jgi:hypothetical protein
MNARSSTLSIGGRPVFVASYVEEDPKAHHVPLRQRFPGAGETYAGGTCDGYEYRSVFAGASLIQSYDMIKAFLAEEGYGDLPLPRDADELCRFRLPIRNKQILLFEDNGYVHNPVKILFPHDRRKKSTLILCLYNEEDPDHLIKFHRIEDR